MEPFHIETNALLKAELHCHSRDDKKDDIPHSEKELIDAAAEQGYEVLSITNHHVVTFSPELEAYAAGKGILLIPGIELTVEGKHVILLNYRNGYPAVESFDDLAAVGDEVAVIAPHAYYPSRQSLNSKLRAHKDVFHAVEYSHFYFRGVNPNRRLVRNAKKWNLPVVGTSDAHRLYQIGSTYSMVRAEKNPLAVIDAIKKGRVDVVTRPLTAREAFNTFSKVFVNYIKHKLLRWIL